MNNTDERGKWRDGGRRERKKLCKEVRIQCYDLGRKRIKLKKMEGRKGRR